VVVGWLVGGLGGGWKVDRNRTVTACKLVGYAQPLYSLDGLYVGPDMIEEGRWVEQAVIWARARKPLSARSNFCSF
jgi:hypothetical protein